METFILHSTSVAEWQALVEEAKYRNSYSITEEIECYLVFLLMRFATKPEIANTILATDFLQSLEHLKKERLASIRDVGDKCLLFAGLFPGHAQKRRVKISYFVKLGQMAYSMLSGEKNSKTAELYADLSEHFVILMDMMHYMRETNENTSAIDVLQAEELWNDTKSLHALHTLKKSAGRFIPDNLVALDYHYRDNPNHDDSNNSSKKH
jgi:hypothetical protein